MLKRNIIKPTVRLLCLSLLSLSFSSSLRAQAPETEGNSTPPPASIFSIEGGKMLLMEADRAIEAQDFDLAISKLQSARQVFNQLSNFYLQLFNSFSGLDNAAAESHRKKALDTSLERDNATYQLALVHRKQNQPELSVPLLIQIITSQSPGIGLGKKAYDQLLEIGFVDVPYTAPKPSEVQNPPPAPNGQPPQSPQPTQPPVDGQPDIPQVTPAPAVPNLAPVE